MPPKKAAAAAAAPAGPPPPPPPHEMAPLNELVSACVLTDELKAALASLPAATTARNLPDGASLLHVAAQNGAEAAVLEAILEAAGAQFGDDADATRAAVANYRDTFGRTALWYAARRDAREAASVLLAHGARSDAAEFVHPRNDPLTLARQLGHVALAHDIAAGAPAAVVAAEA